MLWLDLPVVDTIHPQSNKFITGVKIKGTGIQVTLFYKAIHCTVFDVIYQTRVTVFHRDIQTPRRELKIRCAAEYF